MATAEPFFVVFPEWYDERVECETPSKGYLQAVEVRQEAGAHLGRGAGVLAAARRWAGHPLAGARRGHQRHQLARGPAVSRESKFVQEVVGGPGGTFLKTTRPSGGPGRRTRASCC